MFEGSLGNLFGSLPLVFLLLQEVLLPLFLVHRVKSHYVFLSNFNALLCQECSDGVLHQFILRGLLIELLLLPVHLNLVDPGPSVLQLFIVVDDR